MYNCVCSSMPVNSVLFFALIMFWIPLVLVQFQHIYVSTFLEKKENYSQFQFSFGARHKYQNNFFVFFATNKNRIVNKRLFSQYLIDVMVFESHSWCIFINLQIHCGCICVCQWQCTI